MTYGADRTVVPVTILNGQSVSGEVNTNERTIVGIIMPAAWTAADLSIQALASETSALPKVQTWAEVVDQAGNNVAITAPGAGEYVALSPLALNALGRIRVRSGTLAVPVAQGADRTLQLVLA